MAPPFLFTIESTILSDSQSLPRSSFSFEVQLQNQHDKFNTPKTIKTWQFLSKTENKSSQKVKLKYVFNTQYYLDSSYHLKQLEVKIWKVTS